MKIENIDIQATIEKAQAVICQDDHMSAATKSMFEVLILIISLLANRLNLNSSNSSKPPSIVTRTGKRNQKKVDDPDIIEPIRIDRRTLPAGRYHEVDYEARQVFDIDISRVVTEYRAQVLEDDSGNRYVAPFPEGVTKAVQYGTGIKAHAVYLSQFQLIPYNRIQVYFADQLHIPFFAIRRNGRIGSTAIRWGSRIRLLSWAKRYKVDRLGWVSSHGLRATNS